MVIRSSHCFFLLLSLVLSATLLAQQTADIGKVPLPELQKQADSGDPVAQNEIGVRYSVGLDVEKDPAKAIPWYLKAAKQGYAKAYFNLGAAYYNGAGVPVNVQDYCAWFIFSSDAGDPRGIEAAERTRQELRNFEISRCEVLVATAYLNGNIVRQNYPNALKWYKAAASAGDGMAADQLAHLYDRGIGVSADQAESLKWLQRAADLKYPPALYELGKRYETGENFSKDYLKAKEYYEQASYEGLTQAFAALGEMYEAGHGVKPDPQKALAYYVVAANNGLADARKKVDEISATLSPKQVAAAKQYAIRLVGFTRGPLVLTHK